MARIFIVLSLIAICSCTVQNHVYVDPFETDAGILPDTDLHLTISGLRTCTNRADNTVHLNSGLPVTILSHGCLDSTARFRALADVFAFHGQQVVCFTYNDRDSLVKSSGELRSAIKELSHYITAGEITVIGHSMGGLISRKALIADQQTGSEELGVTVSLVTVSAPFAGISDARFCGSPASIILSLGTVIPLCKLISGDKWHEITYASDFIRNPGKLMDEVDRHIKIVTDERGFCRTYDAAGSCIEDDYVFSTEEQYYTPVDREDLVANIQVKAGHVEIVGDADTAPTKLIRVLQEIKIMNSTEAWREKEFSDLLTELY